MAVEIDEVDSLHPVELYKTTPPEFGHPMRKCFGFSPDYINLNNGTSKCRTPEGLWRFDWNDSDIINNHKIIFVPFIPISKPLFSMSQYVNLITFPRYLRFPPTPCQSCMR